MSAKQTNKQQPAVTDQQLQNDAETLNHLETITKQQRPHCRNA